jgi:hypothetical protein
VICRVQARQRNGPDLAGILILMNADLDPGGGGGDGGTAPLTIASGGQLLGTTASIPVACALSSACRGVLRLTDVPARLRVAASKTGVYGKARIRVRGGQTKSIRVHLTAAGRKKVNGLGSIALLATARVHGQTVSAVVDLTR